MANYTTTGSDTFPAGHVIQTVVATTGTTTTDINVGNNIWTDSVITAAITAAYSTSSIIVHCGFTTYINNTSTDAGIAFRTKKVHSGGTSYPLELMTQGPSGNAHSAMYAEHGSSPTTGQAVFYSTFSMEDPAGGVAGAITYTIQAAEWNTEACGIGNGGGMSGRWWIWFQEIKR